MNTCGPPASCSCFVSRHNLARTWAIVILALLPHCVPSGLIAQGFNRLYELGESTIFTDIQFRDDTLSVFGQVLDDSSGLFGLAFIQFDTSGQVLTQHVTYDTSSTPAHLITNLRESRMEATSDGGYVAFGLVFGQEQIIVLKYTSNGDLLWQRRFDHTERHIQPLGIMEDEGATIIVGSIQLQNFVDDAFAMNISDTGELVWFETYGLPKERERARSVRIGSDGKTYIGAFRERAAGVTNWIYQIDSSGQIVREFETEPDSEGIFRNFSPNGSGFTYLADIITIPYPEDVRRHGQVVHRNDSFDLVWMAEYGSPTDVFNGLTEVIVDQNEDVIAVGQFFEPNFGPGGRRGWVTKLSSDGQESWLVMDTALLLENGGSVSYLSGVSIGTNETIYAVGDGIDYDLDPPQPLGWLLKITADGCVDTLCITTSTGGFEENDPVNVYPNPFFSHVTLELQVGIDISQLKIADISGRVLFTKDVINTNQQITVDLSQLPPGLLIYTLMDDKGCVQTGKLVKVE